MIRSSFRLGLVALVALAGAAVAAHANGAIAGSGGLACGISKTHDQGMLVVEGVVQSPTALSGDYRFSLKSSGGGGSTNINQGGPFMAPGGDAVSVGRVMVGANARVAVDFTVSTGGKTFDCSQDIAPRT